MSINGSDQRALFNKFSDLDPPVTNGDISEAKSAVMSMGHSPAIMGYSLVGVYCDYDHNWLLETRLMMIDGD